MQEEREEKEKPLVKEVGQEKVKNYWFSLKV